MLQMQNKKKILLPSLSSLHSPCYCVSPQAYPWGDIAEHLLGRLSFVPAARKWKEMGWEGLHAPENSSTSRSEGPLLHTHPGLSLAACTRDAPWEPQPVLEPHFQTQSYQLCQAL